MGWQVGLSLGKLGPGLTSRVVSAGQVGCQEGTVLGPESETGGRQDPHPPTKACPVRAWLGRGLPLRWCH